MAVAEAPLSLLGNLAELSLWKSLRDLFWHCAVLEVCQGCLAAQLEQQLGSTAGQQDGFQLMRLKTSQSGPISMPFVMRFFWQLLLLQGICLEH